MQNDSYSLIAFSLYLYMKLFRKILIEKKYYAS